MKILVVDDHELIREALHGVSDVSGGKGTEEILAWIDNYCGQHPSDNLYRASAALVNEFRQKLGR